MKRRPFSTRPTSMTAVSQEMLEQAVLMDEYREALAQWSTTRATLPAGSPKVVAATKRLDDIEQRLANYGSRN